MAETSELTPAENARIERLRLRNPPMKFASCECGRRDVLLYNRFSDENDAAADRYTYHDMPNGVRCEKGGTPAPEDRRF